MTSLGLYNYWIVIALMMIGLYTMISRGHLVKKIVGLNIFQTSVFLLYISLGFVRDGAVPILVGAGGISIHHARALHGSQPNTSPNPRRLLLYQYCAVDAFPLSGISDWNKFNANILRGEPTFAPRLADVPVRVPLPSGEKGGSIYETQAMMEKRMYEVVR